MKSFSALIACLLIVMFVDAQEINKIVLDSEINQEVLSGICNRTGLQNDIFKQWFDAGYENYKPDASTIKELKKLKKDLAVTIIIGTWCKDTKEQVPRFYKISDEMGLNEKNIGMIAINRSKSAGDVNTENFNVTKIPLFIFYKRGVEVGRIIEKPTISLEKDMLFILMQAH